MNRFFWEWFFAGVRFVLFPIVYPLEQTAVAPPEFQLGAPGLPADGKPNAGYVGSTPTASTNGLDGHGPDRDSREAGETLARGRDHDMENCMVCRAVVGRDGKEWK